MRFISLAAAIALLSCESKNEEDLFPVPTQPPIDTTQQISFGTDVLPIFRSNCTVCHGGSAQAGAGIRIDDYATISALSSTIVSRINLPSTNIRSMPQGGPRLLQSEIDKIELWVAQGKQNN